MDKLFQALACFALSLWIFKASDYNSALQTKQWPTVTGTVIQSQVRHVNPNHIRDSFQPDVSYTYKVKGIDYQASSVYSGNKEMGYSQKYSAQKIIQQFPVGKKIRVYYSPIQAQNSVLIPGPIRLHYMYFLFSICLALAGFYFLRVFYLARSDKN